MRIRWTPAAASDLKVIHDYLMEHEPHAARATMIELRQGIRSLNQFPHMGRPVAASKAPANSCTSACRTSWCTA